MEIVVSTMGSLSSSAESSSGGGMSGSASGDGTQVSRGTVIVVGRTGLGGGVVGGMIAAVEGGGGAGDVVGVSGGETGWLCCGDRAVSGSFGCQPKGITVSSRGVKILRKIIKPLARRKVWQ